MTESFEKTLILPCPAEKLIIHRPPMLLIDSLLERFGDNAVASATIDENNPCYSKERGILPEYFIEIMAQTMAAANGYDAIMEDAAPKDGFIVGLDNYSFTNQPDLDRIFTIKIAKTLEFGAMKVMEGAVYSDATLIASGELKVWEQNAETE